MYRSVKDIYCSHSNADLSTDVVKSELHDHREKTQKPFVRANWIRCDEGHNAF